MDEKSAWAIGGGFFIVLFLFRYGEIKEAIGLSVVMGLLVVVIFYQMYEKSHPKKEESKKESL